MNTEVLFRTAASAEAVREGARRFLRAEGWTEGTPEGEILVFTRGSGLRRLFSLRTENWPAGLRVRVFPVEDAATGVSLRYAVRTGLHFVGALDEAVIEAEAAALEETLATGQHVAAAAAVEAARRPVIVAVTLNMVVASILVAAMGILGGYPPVWVGVVATAIAFLDGVVIMAFADLVFESSRHLHERIARLRRAR